MDIFIKKSPHRIDPRHPESSDSRFSSAVAAGKKRMAQGKLKFSNKGEEEHYWKAVHSNPANVPGLPAFFPALEIKSFVPYSMAEMTEKDLIERFYAETAVRDIELYCESCHKITTHSINPRQCFCKKCGDRRPYTA